MKKVISLLLIIVFILFSVCSCDERKDAYQILCTFIDVYGAEGIIYSPCISEGEEGYISSELLEKIYEYSGNLPSNFAIFLSSSIDRYSECAIFVCDDADSLLKMEEICIKRVKLLCGSDERGLIKINHRTIFYSTMQDRNRAEIIWQEIIR